RRRPNEADRPVLLRYRLRPAADVHLPAVVTADRPVDPAGRYRRPTPARATMRSSSEMCRIANGGRGPRRSRSPGLLSPPRSLRFHLLRRAHSSVVEHRPFKPRVEGSKPSGLTLLT